MKEYCRDCKKPSFGKSLCPDCMKKQAERTKRRRQKLISQGLCRECGKPAGKGHIYCEACRKKVNEGILTMRKTRIEAGLCEKCGVKPIYKCDMCQDCYAHALECRKKNRDKKRVNGICLICGAPSDNSFSPYCKEHREKYYRARHKVYWERRAQGLCVICGKPTFFDEVEKRFLARCPECLAKTQDYKYQVKHGLFVRQRRPSYTKEVAINLGKLPLCKYCGQRSAKINGITCGRPDCRKKYRHDYHKTRNQRFKDLGLCQFCKKNYAIVGTLCIECAEKNRENASRQYRNRVSSGICVLCGKVPATQGVHCPECAEQKKEYSREYSREYYQRKKKKLRTKPLTSC